MCIGIPILLTIKDLDSRQDLCKKGVNEIATYSYYGFALISLIFESLLYKQIIEIIPSHIKKIVDLNQNIDENQDKQKSSIMIFGSSNKITPLNEQQQNQNILNHQLITKLNSNFKIFVNSSYAQIIQFIFHIVLSQLAKYDLYNDIVFIINCFTCEQFDLFQASIVITCLNLSLYLIYFTEIIVRRIQRIKVANKYLSTQTINDFYDLCTIGRNTALAQMLDSVAPYNVSVFSNRAFFRYMVPKIAGRSINKQIRNYLIKFLFEDVPQLIMQLIFIYRMTISNSITLGWTIYITLSTSIIAIIISFLKFMQIRPSSISQADFDQLERNNMQIYDFKLKHLNNELNQINSYGQFQNLEQKQEQIKKINDNDV